MTLTFLLTILAPMLVLAIPIVTIAMTAPAYRFAMLGAIAILIVTVLVYTGTHP